MSEGFLETWQEVIARAKSELNQGAEWEDIVRRAREILRDSARFNYQKYLKSQRWVKLREKILQRDGYECQDCKNSLQELLKKLHWIPFKIAYNKKASQVHHEDYYWLWTDKEEEDCVSLCGFCHLIRHNKLNKKSLELERDNSLLIRIYYEILKHTNYLKREIEFHKDYIKSITIKPEDWEG